MADMGGTINVSDLKSGSEALPAGDYRCVIVESSRERTKDGQSELLKLSLQVVEGPQQNRRLTDRLNLWNASQQAREIAQVSLKRLCEAVGVQTLSDSSQLHMKPFIATVAISKNNDQFNEVKRYSPCGSAGQRDAFHPANITQVPTQQAATKPPGW